MVREVKLAEFEAYWKELTSSRPADKHTLVKRPHFESGAFSSVTGSGVFFKTSVFLVPQKVIRIAFKKFWTNSVDSYKIVLSRDWN